MLRSSRRRRSRCFTIDVEGRVTFASSAACRTFGGDPAGQSLPSLFAEDYGELVGAYLRQLAAAPAKASMFCDGEVSHADGSTRWLELQGTNLLTVRGVRGLAVVLHDATQAHRQLAEARRLGVIDQLTGLADRALLAERLYALRRIGRGGCVVFVDLDQFKMINDTFGHLRGDEVLVQAAQRMAAVLPAGATAARAGGDEFMTLLPDFQLPAAEVLAEKMVDAIGAPIRLEDVEVTVTAAAGVATLEGHSADAVFRNADVAMYEAKAAGRGKVQVYRPDSEAFARSRRELMRQVTSLRARNEELSTLALTDQLTGLPNRRSFDESLTVLDATARRSGRSYAVVYFDIDHCHDVNRAFDDATGDMTLRAVAQALSSACRAGDVVYRKGGEELVALLQGTDTPAAHATAQRLADVVRALQLPSGRDDRPVVTVSGGVAALDLARHATPMDVVGEANHAMLLAKRAGRDRVLLLPDSACARSSQAG